MRSCSALLLRSSSVLGLACLAFAAHIAPAQEVPAAQPVAGSPNLLRLEAIDPSSGTHYVRLMLSLPSTPNETSAPPRFTVECTDNAGRHDMSFFVSFGGVSGTAFTPPFHPTPEMRFPPSNPTVKLTMTFEGYMKWKPMTRAWEVLPSGELRYRNPGISSPNLDAPRFFLQYMNSLPGLRIRYAHPTDRGPHELFFETRPMLDDMKKSPLCQ